MKKLLSLALLVVVLCAPILAFADSVPLDQDYLPAKVVVVSVGSSAGIQKSGIVMIDSGSVGSSALPEGVLLDLVIQNEARPIGTVTVQLADNSKVDVFMYEVNDYTVGDCTLHHVLAAAGPVPLLGTNVLDQLVPWSMNNTTFSFTCPALNKAKAK